MSDKPDKQLIAKRIRECREERNFTQEQLGEHLGLNKSTIQRYESAKIDKIKLPILQSIANILKVNPDYLSGVTDEPVTVKEQLTDEEFALFGEVHDLTKEEQQRVLSFIKFTKSQRGDNIDP